MSINGVLDYDSGFVIFKSLTTAKTLIILDF